MNMTKVSFEKIKKLLQNWAMVAATRLLFVSVLSVTMINCLICIIKWCIIYNNFTSFSLFSFLKIYYNREFVNQGYKTEKLFIALNKLGQDQSLHPLCNTLFYILFLSFEITCNTIYIHTGQHSKTFTFLLDNTVHYTRHYIMVSNFVLINIIIGYHK